MVKIGDKAPDFSMPGSDGKTYTLAQFRGKQAVVIAWFPKAFTPGWTAECTSLRDSGRGLAAFDVACFAASNDDAETNGKFAESLKLTFPILSDPAKTAAQAFGALHPAMGYVQRWTYIIDKEGTIVHIDDRVKPDRHGRDLLQELEDLQVPRRATGKK